MHEIKADKCHHKGREISKVCSKQRLLNDFITILTFNWKFIEETEEKTFNSFALRVEKFHLK
jgi:hypothetical protein